MTKSEINLRLIIDRCNLDVKKLAAKLYPNNSYPEVALARIISKQALLNSEQLYKLARMAGVKVQELYSDSWGSAKPLEHGLTMGKGAYTVILSQPSSITSIRHNSVEFFRDILHDGAIPLKDYIDLVDKIINEHENNIKN